MRSIVLLLLASCLLLTCNKRGSDTQEHIPLKMLLGICISDHAMVLGNPNPESEQITSLFLGDEVHYLGETQEDKGSSFLYIELAEGTKAWVDAKAIILNATPAAVINPTAIFEQPHSGSLQKGSLHPAEFIVATDDNYGWYQVSGINQAKCGWVPKSAISLERDDVYIASMAWGDLLDQNGNILKKELPYFIKSIPNQDSKLAQYLQGIYEEEISNAIEESITDYEKNYYTELRTPEE